MGMRGELFTTKMTCEGRTYFFNIKQNRKGDLYLTVVESKPTDGEQFDRRSIVVFREDMPGFLKAFQAAVSRMEKPGARPLSPVSFELREDEALPTPEAPLPEKRRRVVVKRRNAEGTENASNQPSEE